MYYRCPNFDYNLFILIHLSIGDLTWWVWYTSGQFSSWKPRQNCRHFADGIFKCIFLNENVTISLKISLAFVLKVQINNIPALVQIMAWRRAGDKPLSEPMMVSLLTHICNCPFANACKNSWKINSNDIFCQHILRICCDKALWWMPTILSQCGSTLAKMN